MFKSMITLVFTSLILRIYAPDPTTICSKITSEKGAAQELAPIQLSEVLPVVLLITSPTAAQLEPVLQVPEEMVMAVTVRGRMVKGTLFSMIGSNEQIFFCPKENSNEKCLTPCEFEDYTPLQCPKEPTPVVLRDKSAPRLIPCGSQYSTSTSYTMGYDFCLREEPNQYNKSNFALYKFCYDTEKQKTLYTTHFIMSPKLLLSNLLYLEQQLNYPFSDNDQFQTANRDVIANSLAAESTTYFETSYPLYQVQQLVPSNNMALGTWRKTTYQFVNAELQHKAVFPFWNKIDDKVRQEAIRMYDHGIKFLVRTGVFDITTDTFKGDEKILYNMWVKVVTSKSNNILEISQQGVAIIMNNFLNSATANPELTLLQNKIDKYCPNDLCIDSFKRQVESGMRCCQITKEIAQLFGAEITDVNLPVLYIPGLIEIST